MKMSDVSIVLASSTLVGLVLSVNISRNTIYKNCKVTEYIVSNQDKGLAIRKLLIEKLDSLDNLEIGEQSIYHKFIGLYWTINPTFINQEITDIARLNKVLFNRLYFQ